MDFDVDTSTPAGAKFSDDRRFRFMLWRRWDEGAFVNFCMLNPSIANENAPDPTMTRCIGFAKKWGMGGIIVTNAFPLVATAPRDLIATRDRSGPSHGLRYDNEAWLELGAHNSSFVVVGWGTNIAHKDLAGVEWRTYRALKGVRPIKALRTSKYGHPIHPLYLPYDCELRDWKP